MSVSSGSDITIPIQDSPPPPPSPYAGSGGLGSKGNGKASTTAPSDNVTIIDTTGVTGGDSGKKTPEPRGDVTVTVGFVNEAYQNHSPDHTNEKANGNGKSNGAISIAVAGPKGGEKGNGDTTEIHLNEAVNPELINMNIWNTIPDKPNPEYGPYDNMDEYFVPVNTHKKFLRRSEKLYVTKDKRKTTRWKKYICWLVGASVLATIVTVAVLAGIGLIPQKSPSNFDTESVVGTESSASSSSGSIISSTSPDSVIIPSIPMAADIQFHIFDLGYEPALNDKNSDRFQTLAGEIKRDVEEILKTRAGLGTVYSRVTEFAPGSVFVKMRIGWLDQSMDFEKVKMMLSNVTTVGSYEIRQHISSYEVVNLCKFNKNGCSHNCSYDYPSMDFFCSCMDDTFYLAEDNKTCRSMYEVTSSTTSTSTTTEVPFVPELSSEEMFPSSSPKSDEMAASPETVMPDVSGEMYPTSQPEEDHVEPSPVPTDSEEEIATEENISPETNQPVSHEQHVPEQESILLGSSSTTTTTEMPSMEPISEEAIEQHHHEHDLSSPIAAGENTTSTTPEPPVESLNSSEEVISEHTEHPRASEEGEGETTMLSVAPVSHEVTHDSTEQSVPNSEEPKRSSEESIDFGRTDISEEDVKPTESVPEIPSAEHSEEPLSAENATLTESVRNTSEEDHVAPTGETPAVPEDKNDESVETTLAPVGKSESPVEPESRLVSDVPEVEATTVLSSAQDETDEVGPTTIVPREEEQESNQAHHITPMDVLSFSSGEKSSSTTPSPNVRSPVNPATPNSSEHEEGRSLSDESSSVPENASVETIGETGSPRSESLTEDDAITESQQMEDDDAIRGPRLHSNEMTNSMQFLGGHADDSKKANAQQNIHNNVTESASVETADENPSMVSVVTSASSENGTDREAVTNTSGSSENLAPEQNPEKDEGSASVSGSAEFSQEAPGQGSGEERDNTSGERATFAPLSLKHDIDINFVGNLTSDPIHSEPVSSEGTGDVEQVQGVNDAVQVDKEKLIAAPVDDDEEMLEATTTANVPVQVEAQSAEKPASLEQSGESQEVLAAPQSTEQQSQPESDIAPIPVTHPKSEEQVAPVPSSSSVEHTGSREESGTLRSITSPTDLSGSEESLETPNRDHRDTEEDLESPFSSMSVESHEGGYGEPFSKLIEELTTTMASEPEVSAVTTTTTTSTTTTTTTTPIPETTTPVEITTSTTTTTTTEAAPTTTSTTTTAAPVIPAASLEEVSSSPANNNSSSPSINVEKGDHLSQESSSLSMEQSNSHHLENSHELSSSPEELGPISSSNEGASSFLSSSSVGDNNSSDDLHDNELT